MPANLSPDYMEAEARFREAKTDEERMLCLREMLRTIPKHKGTEKLQADIKKKISKLKEKQEQAQRSGKRQALHKIDHEGAGVLALVGVPNVGKSRLLNALTSAETEVAPYPFTTHTEHPGMMPFEDVRVQLVDFPPFSSQHREHWMYELVRTCDGLLLVVDLQAPDPTEQLRETLEVLAEGYIHPVPPEKTPERNERDLEIRSLLVANKYDGPEAREILDLFQEYTRTNLPIIPVSAEEGTQLDVLRERVFRLLHVVRVYSKPPGKPADTSDPFTVPIGSTVADVALVVHKDLAEKIQYARVWGGARFEGQTVGRDYVVNDRDIVELHG